MSRRQYRKSRTIMWLITSLCILVIYIGYLSPATADNNSQTPADPNKPAEKNTITIFLTGNTLGTLKPCGCAAGQLGGLEKRPAILNKVPHHERLLIDTGNFLAAETQQDIIKFDIIIRAMATLEYDIVNLTKDDMRVAEELGLIEDLPFDVIGCASDTQSKIPLSRTRQLQIGSKCLLVAVASISAESPQVESVEDLFPPQHNEHDGPILNILITDICEEHFTEYISDVGLVDVLICPTSADEPAVLDEERKKPLLISVGQLGKYFGRLTVELTGGHQLKLRYTKIPIDEKLPPDHALVQLYKDYQFLVKEENLLEKVIKVPLPNGLEYLGSSSCGFGSQCHQYENEKWSQKGHARAYQTLVDVGSQYDPECIRCHVVGLEYETGFVSEQKSPKDLRNVGCEVCHGPGSKHMMAVLMAEKDTETSEPKSTCIDCHTPEHSNYEGHEEEYLQKIVHWKEPKADTNVKK